MAPKIEKHHHHILPTGVALSVGVALLVLTVITVAVAHIDLGALNFFIAMVVATTKALLVALFFMNLKYDRAENGVIFGTSFLFLAIFIVLTGTDLFFRGDVYVKGPLMATVETKSKLEKPWISTPELVAKGKELYKVQCVSCHGEDGRGDGPAASALNPHPRNFHEAQGWKNGRRPTMVFKTLKEGLPPSAMASYATLPVDDRWALVHYVLSLGPQPVAADSAADFAAIGINPNLPGGGATEAPTISVALAMKQLTVPAMVSEGAAQVVHMAPYVLSESRTGSGLYQAQCAQCHGDKGQGGIRIKRMGGYPSAFVTTQPLKGSESLKDQSKFRQVVLGGLPGEIMPGSGDLTQSELAELYKFVNTL